MATTPVCPLLSVRNTEVLELCVGEDCALYLPGPKKCSLVFIGFKAFAEMQRMQQAAAAAPARQ